jgi:hypothetical protein
MYTELVKSTFIKINSFATKMLKYSPEIITAFWPTKSFLSGTVTVKTVSVEQQKQQYVSESNRAIQVNLAMRS